MLTAARMRDLMGPFHALGSKGLNPQSDTGGLSPSSTAKGKLKDGQSSGVPTGGEAEEAAAPFLSLFLTRKGFDGSEGAGGGPT